MEFFDRVNSICYTPRMGAENVVRRRDYEEEIEKQGPIYMNNFFDRVPRFGDENQRLTRMEIIPGFDADKPFRVFYSGDDSKYWEGENKHSPKFWSMTPREWYELIDSTLEAEVGLEKIREIQDKVDKGTYPIKINQVCVPAYLKLIEMGFTWRDLSS